MPGRPQVLEVKDGTITIAWEPPISDGGSPVLQYVLERREVRGPRWVRVHKSAVIAPPVTIENVLEGNQYEFRVYAQNAIGLSEASEMSPPVTAQLNLGRSPQGHLGCKVIHATPRSYLVYVVVQVIQILLFSSYKLAF